jgi:hypothetical protein
MTAAFVAKVARATPARDNNAVCGICNAPERAVPTADVADVATVDAARDGDSAETPERAADTAGTLVRDKTEDAARLVAEDPV